MEVESDAIYDCEIEGTMSLVEPVIQSLKVIIAINILSIKSENPVSPLLFSFLSEQSGVSSFEQSLSSLRNDSSQWEIFGKSLSSIMTRQKIRNSISNPSATINSSNSDTLPTTATPMTSDQLKIPEILQNVLQSLILKGLHDATLLVDDTITPEQQKNVYQARDIYNEGNSLSRYRFSCYYSLVDFLKICPFLFILSCSYCRKDSGSDQIFSQRMYITAKALFTKISRYYLSP